MLRTMIDLEERVKNQGVVTLTMGELRDAFGYQRLGAHIRWEIASWLRSRGFDYLPTQLPSRETEMIRLFDNEHPVRTLVNAAIELDPEKDAILAKAAEAISIDPDPPVKNEKRVGRPRKRNLLSLGT